jgi:hypothetical protein
MFPYTYYLLAQGETAESASLIRELAEHLWARVRSVFGKAAQLAEALPAPDREALTQVAF